MSTLRSVVVPLFAAFAGCRACDRAPEGPPAELRCEHPDADRSCFVAVAGGTFLRGAQASAPGAPGYDPAAADDEGPPAELGVEPFWMLRDEATADLYRRCLEAGACPPDAVSAGGFGTWDRPEQAHHPLNKISWHGADAACRWLGGHLPSEAQWELAARGPEARRFPWGDDPRCAAFDHTDRSGGRTQAVADCAQPRVVTAPETRHPTPEGLRGLAGNVWEWVDDWYAADAYTTGRPATGTRKVQRGGGWTSTDPLEFRSAGRASLPPDGQYNDVGFRCVWP